MFDSECEIILKIRQFFFNFSFFNLKSDYRLIKVLSIFSDYKRSGLIDIVNNFLVHSGIFRECVYFGRQHEFCLLSRIFLTEVTVFKTIFIYLFIYLEREKIDLQLKFSSNVSILSIKIK